MNNKQQLIKEIESFLAKLKEDKEEIDFSILNDEDIFYIRVDVDPEDNYQYLFKGKDPCYNDVHFLNVDTNRIGFNVICSEKYVTELRKATDKEIALYRKHYPAKQKVWIEVYKNSSNIIFVNTSETLEKHKKQIQSIEIGYTLLEVIEKEY